MTRVQLELWRKKLFERLYSRKLKDTDLKKREKLEKEGRSLQRSRSHSPRDYSNTEEDYGNENRENTRPRSEKEVDQIFQRLHSTRTHSCSRCSRYRDPLALELEKLRREKEKRVHYLQERTRRTRRTDDSDADEDFDPRKHVVDVSRRHPDVKVRDEENGQSRDTGAVARLTNLATQPSPSLMKEKERNANRYYDGDFEDYGDRSVSSSLRSDRREAPPAYEEHSSWQKRDLLHSSGAGRFSSTSSTYDSPTDPLLQRREPNPYADSMLSSSSSLSPRRGILKESRGAAGVGASLSETPRGGGVRFTGERRSALTPFSTEGPVVPSLRLNDARDESPRRYDSRQSPPRYTPSSSSEAATRRAPTFSRTAPPARGSPFGRLAELEDEDER